MPLPPDIFSRREFLKLSGASVAGALVPDWLRSLINLPAAELSSPVSPDGLTGDQIKALYAASLNYAARNTAEANTVARRINFIPGSETETASNMCGPLAAAILKSAGIIPADANAADFWLINPVYRKPLLDRVFPPASWTWIRSTTPLVNVNFQTQPLFPGDVLYNYLGSRYFFYHLMVVTRVDAAGRAYSMTNYRTPDRGFAIDEQLLYDPAKPGDGLFYRWAASQPRPLAPGQRDGFDLWRPGLA